MGSLRLILRDDAEEAVLFIGDSGCEKNSSSLRRKHIPQAIELERRSIGAHEGLDERACHRIVPATAIASQRKTTLVD
jgi:hypothetical protein